MESQTRELTLLSAALSPGTIFSWIPTGLLLETSASAQDGVRGWPGSVGEGKATCSRTVNMGKNKVTVKP